MHKGEKSNKCNQCDYASPHAANLKQHMIKHTGEKPNKCKQCNFACWDKGNLTNHKIIHSGEKSVWLCRSWSRQFDKTFTNSLWGTKVERMQPVKLKTYSGEKTHKCSLCSYASSRANGLRRHLKIHSGKKLNQCKQCNYFSSQAGSLRTHLNIHSGEQMQPMWLQLILRRGFEETFENFSWRNTKQMHPL